MQASVSSVIAAFWRNLFYRWWQCSTALDFYISCFCIFALCLVR